MEQEGFTPLSRRPVRFSSSRNWPAVVDTNTVDVAYLEVLSGGPEGRAVDKDAVNDGPDRGGTVPVDDSRHLFVEMPVVVIRTGMLRARIRVRPHRRRMRAQDSRFVHERRRGRNGIRHQHSPWGVRPSVSRRWLQSSLLANPSKESSSVIEDLQRGSPYHSGCRPRCSTYWDCVSPLHPSVGRDHR